MGPYQPCTMRMWPISTRIYEPENDAGNGRSNHFSEERATTLPPSAR